MTVHSAKNQEWETVFVFWSSTHFRAGTSDEYRRRILYNAVTRAKKNCLVLVFDPDGLAILAPMDN